MADTRITRVRRSRRMRARGLELERGSRVCIANALVGPLRVLCFVLNPELLIEISLRI